jgi:carbonic anhydrase/acetyltransferase-like protein (isoleucine patch superfamily)
MKPTLIEHHGCMPEIHPEAFIAPTATLIGEVTVEQGANVWFGTVLRGDFGRIVVGPGASVQDNAVVHVTWRGSTEIGPDCLIGHGAVLEGCRLGRAVVVGINAVVLQGAILEDECVIAAGSVVTEQSVIPARHLASGAPAAVKKELSRSSLYYVLHGASDYRQLVASYRGADLDLDQDPADK